MIKKNKKLRVVREKKVIPVKEITFEKTYHNLQSIAKTFNRAIKEKENKISYGLSLMNALNILDVPLYESIRGTNCDCSLNNSICPDFIGRVIDSWGLSPREKILSFERSKITKAFNLKNRENSLVKTYTFPVDMSKLEEKTLSSIFSMFREAKWFYNYLLSKSSEEGKSLFDKDFFDEKQKEITRKVKKEGEIVVIPATLKHLTAHNRKAIYDTILRSIGSLSTKKKKGYKVGKLKFTKEVKSLILRQYPSDFDLKWFESEDRVSNKPKFKIRVAGIKQYLPVSGCYQKPFDTYEIMSDAKLLNKSGNLFIAITFAVPKKKSFKLLEKEVGIDWGIEAHVTTSEGKKFNICYPETTRLKRLQKKMQRQRDARKKSKEVGVSKSYLKTKALLQKEYANIATIRKEKAKKIISSLYKKYKLIAIQDDSFQAWQASRYGKAIQSSALGYMKALLKENKKAVEVLGRYTLTSRVCSSCGVVKRKSELSLKDRTFSCKECGLSIDRDVNAAINILAIGKQIREEKNNEKEFTKEEIGIIL